MKPIQYIPLIILMIVTLGVRWPYIDVGLFHHDSVQLANAVEGTMANGMWPIEPAVNGRFFLVGLFAILKYMFPMYSIAGFITVMTVLLSVLAVGMMYVFVKELTSNSMLAQTSSWFLAVSPLFFSVTIYAKSHGPALFFLLLSATCLVRAIKTSSLRWWGAFTFVFPFALMVRLDSLLILPFFILLFMSYTKLKHAFDNRPEEWETCNYIRGAVSFGYLAVTIMILFTTGMIYFYSSDTSVFWKMLIPAMYHFGMALTIPIIILLVLSTVYMVGDKSYELLLMVTWILPFFIMLGLNHVVSLRLFIPILPPVFILAGHILGLIKKHHLYWAAIVFILLIPSIHHSKIIGEYRLEHAGPKELALFVKEHTEPNAIIFTEFGDYGPHIKYFGEREITSSNEAYWWNSREGIVAEKARPIYYLAKADKIINNTFFVAGMQFEDYHHAEFTNEETPVYLWRVE